MDSSKAVRKAMDETLARSGWTKDKNGNYQQPETQTQAGHTEGAWQNDMDIWIKTKDYGDIAVLHGPKRKANGRLIAAAPCLYKALKAMLHVANPSCGLITEEIALARAAIAKAEGTTPGTTTP